MKQILFLTVIMPLMLSCGSSNSEKDQKNYEETKEKLEKREKKNPLDFLTVIADNKKNFIGQTVVKGVIENKASVAAYKKVRLKLLYYKQGTLVTNHEEELDEIIRPNNRYEFKAKYFTPKGTDSVGVSVMSAKVAD